MFKRIRLNEWSEIPVILNSLSLWAFRGHSDSNWELESSLVSSARQLKSDLQYLHNREDWMLYQFKRRAHHYLERLPPENSNIEWLALMQHHGAPTRLVDFTYSFYVACHFAFSRPKADVSIWAINISVLWKNLGTRLKMDWNLWRIHEYRKQSLLVAEEVIKTESQALSLLLIEPDTLSQRESIQQGLFIMPETLSKSFVENLAAEFGFSPDVLKSEPESNWSTEIAIEASKQESSLALIEFRMSQSHKATVWSELDRMNIGEATLFPGLDGYSRSLYRHLNVLAGTS